MTSHPSSSSQTCPPLKRACWSILVSLVCLSLVACAGLTPKPTPTRVPTATRPLPTAVPPTATPVPLGSSQNPILIGVVNASSTGQPTAIPVPQVSQPAQTATQQGTPLNVQPTNTPVPQPTQPPYSAIPVTGQIGGTPEGYPAQPEQPTSPAQPANTPQTTPSQAQTGQPATTPTGVPPNPSQTVQPQSSPTAVVILPPPVTDPLAEMLSQKTGFTIQTVVFDNYPDLIEALNQRKIQAAWLPPLTYLQAYQHSIAQVALVANHFGVYAYGTDFLANAADGYTVYYDSAKNQSTADAADALRQFAGKRPCYVDPTSPSGYVLPKGIFGVESIQTGPEIITQDHLAVIRALYTGGICDFGVTFGIMGDPRTASTIRKDMPDVNQKVIILWQSPAVIPNLNLSYQWSLEQPIRAKLTNALLSLAQTKDGLAAMTATTGYQVDGLKAADNNLYNELMMYVQASSVDLGTLVGK